MDKKNTTIGVILLIAAFGAYFYGLKQEPQPAPTPAAPAVATAAPAAAPASTTTIAAPNAAQIPSANATFASTASTNTEARIITLSNDFIEARFTDFGGAIRDVALKQHRAELNSTAPLVLNQIHSDPILAFTAETFAGLGRRTRYEVVSQQPNEVVFRAVFENRIEVLRRYRLEASDIAADKGDPYQLRHEITFRNLTDQTLVLPRFALSLGTAAPAHDKDFGEYLTTGYNNGEDIDFIARAKLEASGGFFGIGSHPAFPVIETVGNLRWASVENQFFATILTPDQPGRSLVTRRVELAAFAGTNAVPVGITGALSVEAPSLAPKGEATLGFSLYTGPKEYGRLSNIDVFKHDQDKVMQFGFFKFFSQILLKIMTWVHSWGTGWGWAIVITTLIIKIVTLPLTLMSARSMKRMQKLAPEIKELNQRFKDNPQKRGEAIMKLYKERGVNPAGGCLPMLIPLPFFMGFFWMLPTVSELRFAEFLWVHDLSQPDTIGHIAGFGINILPLVLGATMIIQLRITPTPPADNEQAVMMAKMMKWMPLVYVFVAYSMSCALSVYSTANGLFTIAQQLYINRMKDSEPATAVPAGGKKLKNVTPKK